MKIIKKNRGVTLVELLVSIALIITSATVVVSIITASFRSASKTNINEDVRTHGGSALNQITKTIQFADSFDVAVRESDGEGMTNCTLSNSSTRFTQIKTTTSGRSHVLSCSGTGLTIDGVSLINPTKVTRGLCYFTCTQKSEVDTPLIGIYFELSNAQSTLPEKSARINFAKSVKVRNFNQ